MNALCLALLGWAAQFSGYDRPEVCPYVQDVSAAWMEDASGVHAAFGWYPAIGHVIYLDRRTLSRYSTTYRRSVQVHEMTHYLQWLEGDLSRASTCQERIEAELEARYVQMQFMEMNGNPQPVGFSSMTMMCPP
jgi:hypothetical protein